MGERLCDWPQWARPDPHLVFGLLSLHSYTPIPATCPEAKQLGETVSMVKLIFAVETKVAMVNALDELPVDQGEPELGCR